MVHASGAIGVEERPLGFLVPDERNRLTGCGDKAHVVENRSSRIVGERDIPEFDLRSGGLESRDAEAIVSARPRASTA